MTFHLEQTPITGKEALGVHDEPTQALIHFYAAFNGGNHDLMSENWLHSEAAAMSNPLGGIMRGWAEISSLYSRIFDGPASVYVEYYDYSIFEGKGFFQAIGRERGTFTLGETSVDLKIRTSRIYVEADGNYKQLHHHGSIEKPAMLKRYQDAVRSGS
ncbi:MAG: nuclear transport factor 2 family protein [Litorimonas sp.]